MTEPIIIVPYVHENEIVELKHKLGYELPVVFWEDRYRIGSDLAYQTMWNTYPDRDIIILHADMLPLPEDTSNEWYKDLLDTVAKYPEAGIFGMTLLYPAKNDKDQYYIQHAGGKFEDGQAIHFGGGLELFSSEASRQLEADTGSYDGRIREVAWVTFGGIYIRRSVLDACGSFDPSYYWTYYRDVDYCLSARSNGFKIYQTPIKLLHFEGRDNKRIQQQDQKRVEQVNINYQIFQQKWKGSELAKTIDVDIINEES